jgi:hypothetical protein
MRKAKVALARRLASMTGRRSPGWPDESGSFSAITLDLGMNLETGCGHPAFDTTWATSCRLRPQLVIDRPSECEQDVHFLIVELQRRHGASPERGPGPADHKPNRRPIKPSPANGNFLGASVLTRCKPARLSHGGMEHLPRPTV